jgi:hypothetical protein
MTSRKIYWYLYNKTKEDIDLYKADRNIAPVVPIKYNPVPRIINTDMFFILKGMKLKNLPEEYLSSEEFIAFNEAKLKKQLIDGIVFVELIREDDTLTMQEYTVDEVKSVTYKNDGSIDEIEINFFDVNDNSIEISYYYDDNDIKKKKVKVSGEEVYDEIVPYSFVPIIEFKTIDSSKTKNISRVQAIEESIDVINENDYWLQNIFRIHGDPTVIGNAALTFDEETNDTAYGTTEDMISNRTTINFLPVPDGTDMKFLEMNGTVANMMAKDKKDLKLELEEEYPELQINQLTKGSVASGYALYLKMTGLVSLIDKYRQSEIYGWNKAFKYLSEMFSNEFENVDIEFEEIISYNKLDSMNMIITAFSNKLINRKVSSRRAAKLLNVSEEEALEGLDSLPDFFEQETKQPDLKRDEENKQGQKIN